MRAADIRVKGAGCEFARLGDDIRGHDVAGFGPDGGVGFALGIAQFYGDPVVPLGYFNRKKKRRLRGRDKPVGLWIVAGAFNARCLGGEIKPIPEFTGIAHIGRHLDIAVAGFAGAEIEFEFNVNRWRRR